MIERFINNRMYRINQQPDGKWQVRGYEEYNAIVGPIYVETDEIYIFDKHYEVSEFLKEINGGRPVRI